MAKKCIVCGEDAEFTIKGTSDYYCKECAEENFDDLKMLQTVEEEAIAFKEYIKEKMEIDEEEEKEMKNNL